MSCDYEHTMIMLVQLVQTNLTEQIHIAFAAI